MSEREKPDTLRPWQQATSDFLVITTTDLLYVFEHLGMGQTVDRMPRITVFVRQNLEQIAHHP